MAEPYDNKKSDNKHELVFMLKFVEYSMLLLILFVFQHRSMLKKIV